jgi:hypothetical protein
MFPFSFYTGAKDRAPPVMLSRRLQGFQPYGLQHGAGSPAATLVDAIVAG